MRQTMYLYAHAYNTTTYSVKLNLSNDNQMSIGFNKPQCRNVRTHSGVTYQLWIGVVKNW